MRTYVLAVLTALSLTAAAAPVPDAAHVSITLDNFKFIPESVHVPANTPVVLTLTNVGSGGHNFAAPGFFTASTIADADAGLIKKGRVEVAKGTTVTLHLTTPAPGHYPLKCTHFLHAGFGMKGEIVAD